MPGQGFKDIIKIIGRSINENSNPISKLKSIFLQSTCSRRDKGQPEVARALLGEPLYHSTFNYKTICLDFGTKELRPIDNDDGGTCATYKSLMEYFADRHTIPCLQNLGDRVPSSFIEFCKYFDASKGKLHARKNPELLVLITIPYVKYNKENIANHRNYCYYQFLKYADWTRETLPLITRESSIEK